MVLKGKQQHELSCSSCGAPLHDLKMMPKAKLSKTTQPYKPKKKGGKSKKKRKSLFSKVLDEAWDVIEDVFD
ncbi:hypothetical protein [Ruegeria sp. ANG-S4]|uniref:hypothetical protein n=1 Tax=Ruegeria sp. ANG-S4 TaxID=1577904 RepID=UPI00315ACB57